MGSLELLCLLMACLVIMATSTRKDTIQLFMYINDISYLRAKTFMNQSP